MKTIKNYFYNLSYQLLLIIVPIVTIPYLSRILGSNGVGLYGYSNSIMMYFSLVGCLGINLYGQRQIAYVRDDFKLRSKCFFELIIIRFCSSIICSALYLSLTAFVIDDNSLKQLLFIQTIILIANMLDISWYYQGLEDFKKTAIRSIIAKVLSLVAVFVFVRKAGDLWIFTLIMSLSTFLGNLILWPQLGKHIAKTNIKELEIKKHIVPIFILFVPQVTSSIHTILDKTMLGAMTNNDEVAYYQQAQKISNILLVICTSLNTVLMPKIAYLKEQKKDKEIERYLNAAVRFILMISMPIFIGTFSVADDFVPLFFGRGYDGVVPTLRIMACLVVIIGLSNTFGIQFLVPTGHQKEFNFCIIIGTSINVLLNFFLIFFFKSVGATIATIIAETIITILQYCFVKKHCNEIVVVKYLLKYLTMAVIMGVFLLVEYRMMHPGFKRMFTMIFTGILAYFSELIITKDSMLLTGVSRIKSRLIRNKRV